MRNWIDVSYHYVEFVFALSSYVVLNSILIVSTDIERTLFSDMNDFHVIHTRKQRKTIFDVYSWHTNTDMYEQKIEWSDSLQYYKYSNEKTKKINFSRRIFLILMSKCQICLIKWCNVVEMIVQIKQKQKEVDRNTVFGLVMNKRQQTTSQQQNVWIVRMCWPPLQPNACATIGNISYLYIVILLIPCINSFDFISLVKSVVLTWSLIQIETTVSVNLKPPKNTILRHLKSQTRAQLWTISTKKYWHSKNILVLRKEA